MGRNKYRRRRWSRRKVTIHFESALQSKHTFAGLTSTTKYYNRKSCHTKVSARYSTFLIIKYSPDCNKNQNVMIGWIEYIKLSRFWIHSENLIVHHPILRQVQSIRCQWVCRANEWQLLIVLEDGRSPRSCKI